MAHPLTSDRPNLDPSDPDKLTIKDKLEDENPPIVSSRTANSSREPALKIERYTTFSHFREAVGMESVQRWYLISWRYVENYYVVVYERPRYAEERQPLILDSKQETIYG